MTKSYHNLKKIIVLVYIDSLLDINWIFFNRVNYNQKNLNELYDEKTLNFFCLK